MFDKGMRKNILFRKIDSIGLTKHTVGNIFFALADIILFVHCVFPVNIFFACLVFQNQACKKIPFTSYSFVEIIKLERFTKMVKT